MGWVNRRRDHGDLIFLDLRDRSGITQIVLDRSLSGDAHTKAEAARPEYVIAAIGTVRRRSAGLENPNMPTGEIEVIATELLILSDAKTPPFSPAEDAIQNEELRLQYRYLDLRRTEMQHNLLTRHKVAQAIRGQLSSEGFLEIETPFMTRSTPEGARDYHVPSRVHPGAFYALPQSPQIFKQILMISGFDRYFQIVRCFRDEGLRADRQPEFTQIDLEMSYPRAEHVWEVVEGFLTAAFQAGGHRIKTPFPRMDYDDAMRLYGIDKPDMRLPALTEVRECFDSATTEQLAVSPARPILAIRIPMVGDLSRKERDDLKPLFNGKGLAKVFEDFGRLEKSFPEALAKVRTKIQAEPGDLVVLVAGVAKPGETAAAANTGKVSSADAAVYSAAGQMRLALAQKFAARHKAFEKTGDPAKDYLFLWVANFPMFEWNDGDQRWDAAHHPFTSLREEDMGKLGGDAETVMKNVKDPNSPLGSVRALAYDIVLNGTELGSGSIRIHQQEIQSQIFSALGMSKEEASSRFGFFLEALEYGTPPHGGIALGLDRIVMILAGADSLREVIPFPKTARAVDLMVDAPTPVSELQLKELGLVVKPPKS